MLLGWVIWSKPNTFLFGQGLLNRGSLGRNRTVLYLWSKVRLLVHEFTGIEARRGKYLQLDFFLNLMPEVRSPNQLGRRSTEMKGLEPRRMLPIGTRKLSRVIERHRQMLVQHRDSLNKADSYAVIAIAQGLYDVHVATLLSTGRLLLMVVRLDLPILISISNDRA